MNTYRMKNMGQQEEETGSYIKANVATSPRVDFDSLIWKKGACASTGELICFAIFLDYIITEHK